MKQRYKKRREEKNEDVNKADLEHRYRKNTEELKQRERTTRSEIEIQ